MCDPLEVPYTIMPNMGYFELLPHDPDATAKPVSKDDPPPRLVDMADAEVGREYELEITAYTGLCCYRVGDILLVTRFHNAALLFRFVCHKNVLLSINSDKTDEAELQFAVERASGLLAPHSAGHRGVHQPGGRHHHPVPLHRVLGAHGAGGRSVARGRRVQALLRCDGRAASPATATPSGPWYGWCAAARSGT
jgi:hypothetical protein